MDIGLVFSKPGQSTVDIFNNKTRDETSSFVRFKEVMGVPDAFEKVASIFRALGRAILTSSGKCV